MKRLLAVTLILCMGLEPLFAGTLPTGANAHEATALNSGLAQSALFRGQALALALGNAQHTSLTKTNPAARLWHVITLRKLRQNSGVKRFAKYSWLIVSRSAIASLLLIPSAFFVIRNPLLFRQNLPVELLKFNFVLLTSPISLAILGSLGFGYFITRQIKKRWTARQTRITAREASSPSMIRRFLLKSISVSLAGATVAGVAGVGVVDGILALSLKDNKSFLETEEALARKPHVAAGSSDDASVKVAHLPSGKSIRYRVMNPSGSHLVLAFHGWLESLEEFSPEIESTLKEWNIQGIFIDRPGIGPVSTVIPDLNFTTWPQLVEEFVKTEFNNRPMSIVGHSAGGLWATACAKLANVRALALVNSITPMTFGSLRRTILHGVVYDPAEFAAELFPETLISVARDIHYDGIVNHWAPYFEGMKKDLGPADAKFLTEHGALVHKNMLTSIAQGAESIIYDARGFMSPWPYTPKDSAHLPVLSFNGDSDRIVPPAMSDEFHAHVVTHAQRFLMKDMGHLPSPEQYGHVFGKLGELLHSQEKTLARAA